MKLFNSFIRYAIFWHQLCQILRKVTRAKVATLKAQIFAKRSCNYKLKIDVRFEIDSAEKESIFLQKIVIISVPSSFEQETAGLRRVASCSYLTARV